MLTVKMLKDAKKELLKHGGAIYVVESGGNVEVWVNSGGYNAVSMGTHVIQMLDSGAIDYDFVTYQSKNQQINLQEFCDMVNEEYCADEMQLLSLDWETVTHYMDDDLREQIHSELAPCTNEEFLTRYTELHLEKFGEEFKVN